ncbi:MAG: pilus assembly protein PilP [Legionella sp.]|nr:MAG: pilus assembly protein PilP [Legionella sp.]
MTTNYTQKIVLLVALSVLLTACSSDNTDLQNYINEVKQRPGRPIEPIPKLSPLPIFKYPEGDVRRSPFKPVNVHKTDQFAPDQKRKKQPLEMFPLDALKFVGTLKEGNVIWALIKEPDNQVLRVRIGDYMGQNYGRVIAIKEDMLKLEESLQDAGKWQKKVTTINLDTGKE